MRVPLLDLKPQYQSLKKELDEAVIKVAESQYFILGPEVSAMEKEFCDYLGY
jgi:dTDP-4-amino-4,6-dideoxygalactose transaminase